MVVKPTETVAFGLDGRTYEIDLNDQERQGLARRARAKYVAAARRAGGRRYRRQAPHPGRYQCPRDPRLGTLQRAQGARPRPDPVRGARGVRGSPLMRRAAGREERAPGVGSARSSKRRA